MLRAGHHDACRREAQFGHHWRSRELLGGKLATVYVEAGRGGIIGSGHEVPQGHVRGLPDTQLLLAAQPQGDFSVLQDQAAALADVRVPNARNDHGARWRCGESDPAAQGPWRTGSQQRQIGSERP